MVTWRWWLSSVLAAWTLGCDAPRPRPSEAYVWNRRWTPEVRAAITARPASLLGLRVLVMETGAHAAVPALDDGALAGVKVVPVLRVGDALPDEASWRSFLTRAHALEAAGALVTQVEVDFDAPTEALGAYVEWLRATQASLGPWRRSVTALPTWADSPVAPTLSRSVDEVVLQVHTVRAPVLFDAEAALLDAQRWARATGRPFRVALPAYRTQLATGEDLAAAPQEVAQALEALSAQPLVTGFVFFRLGNALDRGAWSLPTLEAVVTRARLDGRVTPRLAPVEGALVDVWLDNDGTTDALAPTHLHLDGPLEDLLGTTGYVRHDAELLTTHPLWLTPGEHIRVGSARGENLHVTHR